MAHQHSPGFLKIVGDAKARVREVTVEQVKDKLDQASSDMDKVAVRSRAITKKLRHVEELPSNPQPLFPELLRGEDEEDDVPS